MKKDDKQLEEKGFGVVELDEEDLAAVTGGLVDDTNVWKCVENSGNCVAGCACPPAT